MVVLNYNYNIIFSRLYCYCIVNFLGIFLFDRFYMECYLVNSIIMIVFVYL